MSRVDFSDLRGLTLTKIENLGDELLFTTVLGRKFKMWHSQDCCESVSIEDITGDLNDLVGSPILFAEESSNSDHEPGTDPGYDDSFTWTFYKLSTINGSVTIRWYGSSNGYYSESVDFDEVQ